ncbi:hypothetical protein [Streptomyces poonensis]|uniref:Uncharacterized protein n=1 Tax=Streptomyces poonensis TaxID=68255 RepID=A0A918Q4H8_9ACTN|nr:hypothetical protein [Streptomyces poonensis]GGZ32861.1 hypothetical protein GCM10010365_62270 [Streptomyces poonensis]GLJ93170.1 hypothetical protein GCM10017589_57820 [Streptomyces poonensis]
MIDLNGSDSLLTPIEPEQLTRGAVIAQSLDNQWVPADMTKKMIKKGKSLLQVERKRGRQVRAEYFRSLINAEQVVINRAFFYNNRAISRDLTEGGAARAAHQKLLASGALVPFLLAEHDPAEEPPSYLNVDRAALIAWQETVESLPATDRVRCVRLSWDDQENYTRATSRLFQPFSEKVQALSAKQIDLLAEQVGVAPEHINQFRRRLGAVVGFSNELNVKGELVVRNTLYKEFVTAPGTDVVEGVYDGNKEFAGEIKQLLDLIYNVNLADALGRYPLTPVGSLRRIALQEAREARANPALIDDPEQLVVFLRQQMFAAVQDRLTPSALDLLALEDIGTLRDSAVWHGYMRAFNALTDDPAAFSDSVGHVFDRYLTLNKEIVRLADERHRPVAASEWVPVVEVLVTVGSTVYTAISGGGGSWEVYAALGAAAMGPVGGSVQLILRNREAGRREQKFAREIAALRLAGEDECRQLLDLVRRLPGYRGETAGPASPVRPATASTTTQDNELNAFVS